MTTTQQPQASPGEQTAPEPVIEFRDVHKRYGTLKVLQGLDLQVQRGEVFGFLGRNGAGKSTAIKMMMGISKVTQGSIALFGEPVHGNVTQLRQRIGYVAQEQNFYPWMSPATHGRFVRGFYPNWDQRRYASLLKLFELPPARKIGVFSGGMKAKLALSTALATRPECLILDEPTAGMDPVARREFLDLVSDEARNADVTLFFSTHLIDDIEAIADRIAIIESGKSVYQGRLEPLARRIATYSIPEGLSAPGSLPAGFEQVRVHVLKDAARHGQRTVVLYFPEGVPPAPAATSEWQQQNMSLEDVFIALVARSG